jgi:hypothetical protein
MRFKTKDLLVNITPTLTEQPLDQQRLCAVHSRICVRPTFDCNPTVCFHPTHCGACSAHLTCGFCSFRGTFGCGNLSCGGGSACDPTLACGLTHIVIEDLEDLVSIRRELQETLKGLDKLEADGLPSAFRSKRDAEAVERGLEEALAQVRAQKAKLK